MKTRAMLPEHPGFEVLASVTLNEALYCAFQRRDYEEALQRCLELAERFGSRRVLAFERSVRGYILLLEGRWAEALIHAGEGLSALAEHCPEQLWQRRHTRFVILRAQLYRGAWGDISEQLREMKVGPVDEDNLLWKTMLASGVGAWIRMAEDEAEVGIQETIESLRSWPSTTFWQPQAYAISALGNLYLYIGEFDEAWALLRSSWRLIKNQSHQLDPCLIAEIAILRAKIALQIAKRGQRVEHWVRVARTSMDIAANEKLPWVDGMVFVLEALIEQLNGVGDGREGLLKAYAHFGEVDMQMHVAILAIVLEGGVEDPLAARNWLSEQGVRDLRRFAAVMVPTA
jgi:tetratricopeptide (TPR) repeat protein